MYVRLALALLVMLLVAALPLSADNSESIDRLAITHGVEWLGVTAIVRLVAKDLADLVRYIIDSFREVRK